MSRWYVVEGVPASTAGAVARDAAEYVVATFATRRGADRWIRRTPAWQGRCRLVPRRVWEEENGR